MSELCAECGQPILTGQGSYYARDPAGGDFGRSFHSERGDPLGIKAKDAEIERLRAALTKIRYLEAADADTWIWTAQEEAREALDKSEQSLTEDKS